MKKASETRVVIKLTNDDRTLILTDADEYYGLTICETKKADKRKIIDYSHILFSKEKFVEILKNIYLGGSIEFRKYFSCECRSEVLRIWYTPEEEWLFEIFDNYFLKCPKGIKDYIYLNKSMLVSLCNAVGLS